MLTSKRVPCRSHCMQPACHAAQTCENIRFTGADAVPRKELLHGGARIFYMPPMVREITRFPALPIDDRAASGVAEPCYNCTDGIPTVVAAMIQRPQVLQRAHPASGERILEIGSRRAPRRGHSSPRGLELSS